MRHYAQKIARMISCGNLKEDAKTADELMASAESLTPYGAVGQVLFKATNGSYYTVTIEPVLSKVNEDFARKVISQQRILKRP